MCIILQQKYQWTGKQKIPLKKREEGGERERFELHKGKKWKKKKEDLGAEIVESENIPILQRTNWGD